jgi:spermidine synthase
VVEQPETKWAHRLRGFRPNSNFDSTDVDLFSTLGSALKEEIASFQTDFQQIDIYDVLLKQGHSLLPYKKSLSNDGSYESLHPFLFQPDRLVMLDGWVQSTSKAEAAYHEALVHPALFTHANPKRVSIIGGGEAATLREVLKHNTIEKAVMIEIDEMMVTVSRDFLPQWSNCSNLVGSAAWCVEDPRTTMYYEDALAWFMDRYGNDTKSDHDEMDVIIMDAL